MSFVNKIVGNIKPSLRFDGWLQMGAVTREADTRTTEQLLTNIDYFAEHCPEIARFKNELKSFKPEFLPVVSDMLEIVTSQQAIMTNQNLRSNANGGRSVLQMFLDKLIKLSKESPEYMSFAERVINNTDTITAKYFMADTVGVRGDVLLARDNFVGNTLSSELSVKNFASIEERYKYIAKRIDELCAENPVPIEERNISNFMPLIAEQMKVTEDLVPYIARETLSGGPETLEPQVRFMNMIKRFLNSDTPVKQMRENIEVLPQVMENAKATGKTLDIYSFVNNNVNLY